MTLTLEGLNMTAPDADPAEVLYSITASLNGFIINDSRVADNFTLEDVLSSSVAFMHSPGTESETVGFDYVLKYGGVESEESQVKINILTDMPVPKGGTMLQVKPSPPPQTKNPQRRDHKPFPHVISSHLISSHLIFSARFFICDDISPHDGCRSARVGARRRAIA